jgi:hypothetical protein
LKKGEVTMSVVSKRFQTALAAAEALPPSAQRRLAEYLLQQSEEITHLVSLRRFAPDVQTRFDTLMEASNEGTLSSEERAELSDLVAQYEQMMLLNSEALLRGTHPQLFDESGRLVQSRLDQATRTRHPGRRTSDLEAEELS